MNIDLTTVAALVALALGCLNLVAAVRTLLSAGEQKLDQRLRVAEKTLIDHDRRIQTVEGEMKHLPDKGTAHKLELALADIVGRLNAMDERMKPIAATSERLHDLLLEQARK